MYCHCFFVIALLLHKFLYRFWNYLTSPESLLLHFSCQIILFQETTSVFENLWEAILKHPARGKQEAPSKGHWQGTFFSMEKKQPKKLDNFLLALTNRCWVLMVKYRQRMLQSQDKIMQKSKWFQPIHNKKTWEKEETWCLTQKQSYLLKATVSFTSPRVRSAKRPVFPNKTTATVAT